MTLAGATVVEIGTVMATTVDDLHAAVTDRTVAILYIAGPHLAAGSLDLATTVAAAQGHRLPVIVDAAAQLPPRENLWHFIKDLGADLALFSGGKDLCGPQASGLMVGRRTFIDAVALHGSPNQRLARALKTGKEEMMGLLAAVERYLSLDEAGQRARWDRILAGWQAELGDLEDVVVQTVDTNEAGQPIPRLIVSWPSGQRRAADVITRLADGEPAVTVATAGVSGIALTPETVEDDQVDRVTAAVRLVLANGERGQDRGSAGQRDAGSR